MKEIKVVLKNYINFNKKLDELFVKLSEWKKQFKGFKHLGFEERADQDIIYYVLVGYRDETEEECKKRIKREKEEELYRREHDKEEFERLRRIFGGDSKEV